MFKQLLISSALAVSLIPPVSAEPVRCWIDADNQQDRVPQQVCDLSARTNANGHTVVDLTDDQGTTVSIVMWKDRSGNPLYAEMFFPQGRQIWQWKVDRDGDIHLYHRETGLEIWFSPGTSRVSPRTYA